MLILGGYPLLYQERLGVYSIYLWLSGYFHPHSHFSKRKTPLDLNDMPPEPGQKVCKPWATHKPYNCAPKLPLNGLANSLAHRAKSSGRIIYCGNNWWQNFLPSLASCDLVALPCYPWTFWCVPFSSDNLVFHSWGRVLPLLCTLYRCAVAPIAPFGLATTSVIVTMSHYVT